MRINYILRLLSHYHISSFNEKFVHIKWGFILKWIIYHQIKYWLLFYIIWLVIIKSTKLFLVLFFLFQGFIYGTIYFTFSFFISKLEILKISQLNFFIYVLIIYLFLYNLFVFLKLQCIHLKIIAINVFIELNSNNSLPIIISREFNKVLS